MLVLPIPLIVQSFCNVALILVLILPLILLLILVLILLCRNWLWPTCNWLPVYRNWLRPANNRLLSCSFGSTHVQSSALIRERVLGVHCSQCMSTGGYSERFKLLWMFHGRVHWHALAASSLPPPLLIALLHWQASQCTLSPYRALSLKWVQ